MSLQDCPVEVVEMIVALLELRDICSLRITGRAMAYKVMQRTFKSYFSQKHIDLNHADLEAFVQVTQPGWMGTLMETLIITNTAFDARPADFPVYTRGMCTDGPPVMQECTPETAAKASLIFRNQRKERKRLRESHIGTDLLCDAFSNLAAHGRKGALRTLTLKVDVRGRNSETRAKPEKEGDWKLIWDATTSLFHTVMASLALSGLSLEALDVFSRDLRCSLAYSALCRLDTTSDGLKRSLKGLRSLSISLSARVLDQSEVEYYRDTPRAPVVHNNNLTGVPSILASTPRLERLELHWFKLLQVNFSNESLQAQELFRRVTEQASLEYLTECKLRGVFVAADTFLTFLKRSPIKKLAMSHVNMAYGSTFEAAFEYCTSDGAHMEQLFLSNLWEGPRLIFFEDPSSPKRFFSLEGSTDGNTLERSDENMRRPIKYVSIPLSMRSAAGYCRSIEKEYGPP